MAKLSKRSIKLNTVAVCMSYVVANVTQGMVISCGFDQLENGDDYFVMEYIKCDGNIGRYNVMFDLQEIDYIMCALSHHISNSTFYTRMVSLSVDTVFVESTVSV